MEAGRSSHVKICYSFPQLKRHFALYCDNCPIMLRNCFAISCYIWRYLRYNALLYANIAQTGRETIIDR